MSDRESQFSERESDFGWRQNDGGKKHQSLPKGLALLVALVISGAGFWLLAPIDLGLVFSDLQRHIIKPVLSELDGSAGKVQQHGLSPPSSVDAAPPEPGKPKPAPNSHLKSHTTTAPVALSKSRARVALYTEPGQQTETVHLIVGGSFIPVEIKIGTRSKLNSLFDQPDHLYKRLPRFSGRQQKFGLLQFANGLQYRFVLDMAEQGYQLFLDRNRNGDLRDDGNPLPNRGTGRFATTVSLPLDQVTGIPELDGEYHLWLYISKSTREQDIFRFYAKTQLGGQLRLGNREYSAYLAENRTPDGDYCNDGINIDLNGNGKIELKTEYVASGTAVQINGQYYRFNLICTPNGGSL